MTGKQASEKTVTLRCVIGSLKLYKGPTVHQGDIFTVGETAASVILREGDAVLVPEVPKTTKVGPRPTRKKDSGVAGETPKNTNANK